MTAESTCPNGRRLLAEWERLQAQGESLRVAWGLEVTASGLCQADERLLRAAPAGPERVEDFMEVERR